jgi:hypothetical protein
MTGAAADGPGWETVRNIGPSSRATLIAAGITEPTALAELGPVRAYLLVRDVFPGHVKLNLLWALAGADLDLDWRDLPPNFKHTLGEQIDDR